LLDKRWRMANFAGSSSLNTGAVLILTGSGKASRSAEISQLYSHDTPLGTSGNRIHPYLYLSTAQKRTFGRRNTKCDRKQRKSWRFGAFSWHLSLDLAGSSGTSPL
jgi:hypothetical protein